MAQKAVTTQERLEKLVAGAAANPDGPNLDTQTLQGHVTALNTLEYDVSQAKLALTTKVKARDERLALATTDAQKSEFAVKAMYGPRSPKLKEYILTAPAPSKPRSKAS